MKFVTLSFVVGMLLMVGVTAQAVTVINAEIDGSEWTGFANGVPDLSDTDYLNGLSNPFTVGTGSTTHPAGCTLDNAGLVVVNDGVGSTENDQTLLIADGEDYIRLLIDLQASVYVGAFNSYSMVTTDEHRHYQVYDLYGSNDVSAPPIDGDPTANGWALIASVDVTSWPIDDEFRTGAVSITEINARCRYLLFHAKNTESTLSASSHYVELDVVLGDFPEVASSPSPADEDTDVLRDVVLGWTPGEYASAHDLYFGTTFDDVNDASQSNPLDVLVGPGLTANTYALERLDFGQTYYWRVDEIDAPPENTLHKGTVWSFTVEPVAIPIDNVTVVASSAKDPNGLLHVVDGSGLNLDDLHGSDIDTMWLSADEPEGAWIQFEFDKAYALHEMLVWNHNTNLESLAGYGAQDVLVQYSLDGSTWDDLGAIQLEQAPGEGNAASAQVIDLAGTTAQGVRLKITSNYSPLGIQQFGLSEVRFLCLPTFARAPQPKDGAVDVDPQVILSWRAGRQAALHGVYLSTEEQAVIDGTDPVVTPADASYSASLDLGGTYYWRIDEVNDVETPSAWQGDVWSFSTAEYLVVDDFESYTDDIEAGEAIFLTWIDGYEMPGNGSTVGHLESPFAEQAIVKSGKQSMPLFYDNSGVAMSEAEFTPSQDWTANGIQSLAIAFAGAAGNTGQLYVKINGTKIAYDGDAGDIAQPVWCAWNIELSTVGGSLSNVTSLTIGVEGSGATGVVYIDDIRLYPKAPEYAIPTEPDTAGLVVHYAFEGTTNDSSGQGYHGTAIGDPAFVAGQEGQAIELNGLDQSVSIPHCAALKPESELTISAWVKPDDITFNRYTAIYRKEDGNARQLFSFQENGTILALGLGIGGGYAELDAPINPSDYTDGDWHLITATYDGSYKRLYVDGGLIGQAAASGPLMTGTADAYIGSNSGTSNWLDGQIDDFRFYSRALSLDEILWLAGRTTPVHKPF